MSSSYYSCHFLLPEMSFRLVRNLSCKGFWTSQNDNEEIEGLRTSRNDTNGNKNIYINVIF